MDNKTLGTAYYLAMGRKDIQEIEGYLHPDVSFSGPLGAFKGKTAVLEIIKGFLMFLKGLHVRTAFGSETEAMVVYDCEFHFAISRGAARLSIKDSLITDIELFYDSRPIMEPMKEIFRHE